jgi:hypothetical protein
MVIKTTLKLNFSYTFRPFRHIFFLKPELLNPTMPRKALITLAAAILLVVLIILANTTESPSQGISGASGGTVTGLEKDLPNEKKIPTH